MKHLIPIILLLCLSAPLVGQTTICTQGSVTVSYLSRKFEEVNDGEKWKLYVTISNTDTVSLFYTRPYKNSPLGALELVPAYLHINVPNSLDFLKGPIYVNGSLTLHITETELMLYKVSPKSYDKTYTVKMPRGEEPQVGCEFSATLLPLGQFRMMMKKR